MTKAKYVQNMRGRSKESAGVVGPGLTSRDCNVNQAVSSLSSEAPSSELRLVPCVFVWCLPL